MKRFLLLSFISLLFINLFYGKSAETGIFMREVNFGTKTGMIDFYVPDDYDSTKSYPLIMGMSPGGGPGGLILGMILPFAQERKIILACPDFVISSYPNLDTTLAYTCREYNIDKSNVITTGYSAGGATTFPYAAAHPDKTKGAIGIAPSVGGVDYLNCASRAFALICGTADGTHGAAKALENGIINAGGACLFISKEGVSHIDPYYGSPEFLEDFETCYDFIQNYDPGPKVTLVSPADSTDSPEEPIKLTWNKLSDATGYNVRLFINNYNFFEDSTQDTTYILPELVSNTNYL